jgi:hypothetical protein
MLYWGRCLVSEVVSDFLLAELLKDVRPSCGVMPRSAVRRQHEHAVSSVDSRHKAVLRKNARLIITRMWQQGCTISIKDD